MVNRGQKSQNMSGIKAMREKIIVVVRRSIWVLALSVGGPSVAGDDGACQFLRRVRIAARRLRVHQLLPT